MVSLSQLRKEKIRIQQAIHRVRLEGEEISKEAIGEIRANRDKIASLEQQLANLERHLANKLKKATNPQYVRTTQSGLELWFSQEVPKVHNQLRQEKFEDFKSKINRLIGNSINQYINEVSKVVQNCRNEMRRSNNKNIR